MTTTKISQLSEVCPECGKRAVAKYTINLKDKDGNDCQITTLECFHIIKKVFPKGTPFHQLVSNDWKPEVNTCQHQWNKTKCEKCGEFKLFQFQIIGALFAETAIAVAKGAGIFDEMGLGKTVQALSVLKYHPELSPTLYIVKSGIRFQWFKEIIRWIGPSHMPLIIESSKDFIFPNLKSYIISYDLLRRMPAEKIDKLGIKSVVLDECQQIKNDDSTRTKEVRRIVKNPEVKIFALSGTPWKNRASEYYPVLNMLDPMKFYSFANFINNWVDVYWDGAKKKEGGIKYISEFKKYSEDIAIRRERTEVMAELPLISRNKLHVKLESLDQQLYDEEVSEFVKWYNNLVMGGEEDSIDSLELLARMSRMRHLSGLAKIPATIEYLEEYLEETDKSIVVFVHHKDVGQLLVNQCQEKFGKEVQVLAFRAGDDRFLIAQKFNSKRSILIASTLASGEGVDGLQHSCSDCIMHERQWNPMNEEQAESRLIRIGQESQTVTGTYVEGEDTIDVHFDMIVEMKRRQFHEAMNKGEAPQWSEGNLAKLVAESIVKKFNSENSVKNKNFKNKLKLTKAR